MARGAEVTAIAAWATEVQWPGRSLALDGPLLALALDLHLIPGFPDPAIARDIQVSPAPVEMTLRTDFDKGVAGLLLLGYFSSRPGPSEWPRVLALGLVLGVAEVCTKPLLAASVAGNRAAACFTRTSRSSQSEAPPSVHHPPQNDVVATGEEGYTGIVRQGRKGQCGRSDDHG